MSPAGPREDDRLLIALLSLAVLALMAASMAFGRASLPVGQAIADTIAGNGSLESLVLMELRLPRALLGTLIGASLGLSGAAMQGMMRNPLVEPGVIGVSACAALGSVLAFYSGASAAFDVALPLGGAAGALAAVLLLFALAGRRSSTVTLILAGVAISGFAGALTSLALSLAPNPFAVYEIMFWLMGSLADRSQAHVLLALAPTLIGWVLLLGTRSAIDALTLGEDTAESLGVDLARARLRLILGTALCVGAAVSVAGAIGFVGLVVPHLLRPLVGREPGRLLLPSALGGAALLLASDVFVRLPMNGPELRLGVITALLGAPFFVWLVLRERADGA